MRNFSIAVALFVFAIGADAADNYTLDAGHSFPRFEINHFGFSTHRGQFNQTAGKLTLDRAAKTGTIEITVQTASIGTGVVSTNGMSTAAGEPKKLSTFG